MAYRNFSQSQNRRMMDIRPLTGSNGSTGRIQIPREMCEIIVSVKKGSLDVWFGEFTDNHTYVPHLHFGQTNAPVWIPIPNGVNTISYKMEDLTSSNLIVASIILGGP